MAGKEKDFKKALKAEVAPLLIVLRKEIAGLTKVTKLLVSEQKKTRNVNIKSQEFPDVQKVETINPQTEVKVKNFPEATRVKGIRGLFSDLGNKIRQGDEGVIKILLLKFDELRKSTLKVEVQNQKAIVFPKVQTVDFVKELKHILKQAEVQRVKIENSTPGEAVPVVLTSTDKKKFYNAISEVVRALGGGGGRPDVRDLAQKASDEGHTYTFATGILSSANNQNENELILIRNPAGSKRILRIEEFNFQSDGNIIIFVNVYKAPTVTDTGTPITINKTR
ncbi:hypothetical protein LCGC14_1792800, partial [marine sediment metagenome]